MKKLVEWLFVLLLCAPCAWAQFPTIPIRQSCSTSTNAASINCILSTTNSGDAIIIGISYFGTTNTASATDTLTTSYTRVLSDTSHTERVAVLTGIAGSTGANTINVAVTGASFMNVNAVELIGTSACDVTTVDASATSTFFGTPSTVTTPGITTTLNSDCIYAGMGNDNNAGWQGLQDADMGTWWQVGSMGGTDSGAGFLRIAGAAGAGNTITVDNGGTSGTLFNIAFKSNALTIQSPSAAPDGDTTHAYSYTVLATGGAGAYSWSVSSGALPTGLSINSSTGAITGTPSVSNNYSATIQVQDAGAVHTATKSITFKITTGLNAITFVQGTSVAGGQSGAPNLAYVSNVTSGNLLVVNMGYSASFARIGYCTDSIGTPYKLLTAITNSIKSTSDATNIAGIMVMAGTAPSSGANTVSCVGGGGTNFVVSIAEFSNANFVSSDNTGFTRGTTATPATLTSNSLTTLVPNELIFGVCFGFTNTGLMTVNASFTQIGNVVPSATGYRIVTTATGYTMSCSEANNTSGVWAFGLVALRPANGTVAPPSSVPRKHGTFVRAIKRNELRIETI